MRPARPNIQKDVASHEQIIAEESRFSGCRREYERQREKLIASPSQLTLNNCMWIQLFLNLEIQSFSASSFCQTLVYNLAEIFNSEEKFIIWHDAGINLSESEGKTWSLSSVITNWIHLMKMSVWPFVRPSCLLIVEISSWRTTNYIMRQQHHANINL